MHTRLTPFCVLGLTVVVLGTATTPGASNADERPRSDEKGNTSVPAVLKGHAAPVNAAVFSADGKTLVTTDADGIINVWDTRTGAARSTIMRFSTQVTKRPEVPVTLAVSPDGAMLATSLGDDVPRLWNAATGRERTVLRREPEASLVMAFSPSGRLLTFRGRSGTIEYWDVDTEPNERGRVPPREVGRIEVKEPQPGAGAFCFPAMTFSPDGKVLATIAPDRTVVLRETATDRELARITDRVIKADPKTQNEARYHFLTAEQMHALGASRPFTFDDVGLAFSPDGRTLALGGPEITLWDVWTGKKTRTLPARAREGFARLAFSPDSKTLTSASPASAPFGLRGVDIRGLWTGETKKGEDFIDVRVRQWDLATGRETAAAVIRAYDSDQLHHGWQRDLRPRTNFVALSANLMAMAAAGPDNTVRVWDVAAGLLPVPEKKREPKR